MRLERGIVVHGRVVDDEGDPIAGAGVLIVEEVEVGASATHPGILPQRRIDAARSAGTTFADGSYLLANVGQGRFHLTVGKLPQHVSTDTESFTLIGGEGTIALSEVVLARAATVTGIVFDDAGRPDHAAVVTAFPQVRMSGGPPSPAGTDAQGHYRLEGLRPGTWRMRLTDDRKFFVGQGSGGGTNADGERETVFLTYDIEQKKLVKETRLVLRNGLSIVAVSPDGNKIYLGGRGHEIVVHGRNHEYLKTVELSGEFETRFTVIRER